MKKQIEKSVTAKKLVAEKKVPKTDVSIKTTKVEAAAAPAKKRGRNPGKKPAIGWPKDRAFAMFKNKGYDAALKLCLEMDIVKSIYTRWLDVEFGPRQKKEEAEVAAATKSDKPSAEKAPTKAPAKKTSAKAPAKKTKAPTKKAA